MTSINQVQQTPIQSTTPNTGAPNVNRENLPLSGQYVPPPDASNATDSDLERRKTLETRASLDQMVKQLNGSDESIQRNLNFSVDQISGRMVIKVFNSETKEMIRQIPSEEVLSLAQSLGNEIGALLDVLA